MERLSYLQNMSISLKALKEESNYDHYEDIKRIFLTYNLN